jgi:hypothetical protein
MLLSLCIVPIYAVKVEGPIVATLIGDVSGPPNIKARRALLKIGDKVEVPANSLLVLEYSWPSDVPQHDCIRWEYIKGPDSRTLERVTEIVRCPIERNPKNCNSPACLTKGTLYFYGDAKLDDPNMPEKVKHSIDQMYELEKALNKLKRERG